MSRTKKQRVTGRKWPASEERGVRHACALDFAAARVTRSQISLLGYRLRAVNHDLWRIYILGNDLIYLSFKAIRDGFRN